MEIKLLNKNTYSMKLKPLETLGLTLAPVTLSHLFYMYLFHTRAQSWLITPSLQMGSRQEPWYY